MTHLITAGHFAGKEARVIEGSEKSSERWRDSVLVELRDRYGQKFFRRIERKHLIAKDK